MLSAETERAILERLQAAMSGGADPTAMPALTADLDRLFGAYQDRIYWTCLRFVGNQERALEIAQEALLLGWQKLPEFRPEARFGTWLHRIVVNLCIAGALPNAVHCSIGPSKASNTYR